VLKAVSHYLVGGYWIHEYSDGGMGMKRLRESGLSCCCDGGNENDVNTPPVLTVYIDFRDSCGLLVMVFSVLEFV
jgi:hypothetical protein